MKVIETECKNALVKTKIPGCDYTLNPYIGCQHACIYCYMSAFFKKMGHKEEWGELVKPKTNIHEVLEEQLKTGKYEGKTILMSSATDAYQPLEKKYELTRKCLEVMAEHDVGLDVLTKSKLILRDLDLITEFKKANIGVSINTLNDEVRRVFEPLASTPEQRLKVLKKLKDEGLKTYAFIAPALPFLTNLEELFKELHETGVDLIIFDKLNLKTGCLPKVQAVVNEFLPEYSDFYSHASNFKWQNEYWQEQRRLFKKLAEEYKQAAAFAYRENFKEAKPIIEYLK